MHHVDALSRNTHILTIDSNSFEENLVICQSRDEKIKSIAVKLQETELKDYELRNGIIYKKKDKDGLLFYVPSEMESHVLFSYHDQLGHV